MNKNNFHLLLKSLLPTPLFFFLSILLPLGLQRYSNIGPVSSGQPLFQGHWPLAVDLFLYGLMVLGLVYSLKNAYQLQGKTRWQAIALVLVLLPFQYILILATQVGIFGK
jgi:hypothetical protein